MNTGPGSNSEAPREVEQAALGPRKGRTAPVRTKEERSLSKKPEEGRRRAQARTMPPWLLEVRDWGRTLVIAVLVVLGMHYFVFSLSTVKGQSMQPTLYEKEWLIVNKISYRLGSPQLGDVVILHDPAETAGHKEYLVKRIVGSPGDRIEIRQGELYRNGKLVLEPYTDALIEDADFGPVTVAGDHYFVMGDNRHAKASRDSREFQAVPRSEILGRADIIMWPITRWAHL
ncbi:signal peptidase I [Paenibacillus rhizovicinus]|uniref:Signal peptidase I n=1 Tax=Paenibacillus rhizovicinus TaxID=2704463 RepID=A0A6C0NZ66_9BACL|nr:signal peptidase I [Paenibacillus rhizovicinus]QHW31534.1 signal peptidase I [Paenibacillus rhizovicinus]